MSNKEDDQSYDLQQMEKWLENYFLDPLTTYLDQMQFRIDLYETDKNWIVEALLSQFEASEITVFADNEKLIIKAQKALHLPKNPAEVRERIIDFPFPIVNQKIAASFHSGILEITISKEEKCSGKNRFITLP
ncbi:Hsp20/alpha crystallin family protein [Neobacillus sp. SM06]|uniref:Hsp20/alpha crystallin family protein n=1 Tax=Neobacillus sp. SM06 TaxID=3422492 RepID=UPI003D2AF68D